MPKISIYLPEEDSEKLGHMATAENRSVSNMVATIVQYEFVRRYAPGVESVKTLPHPAGAKAVPVVTLRETAQ